MPRFLNQQQVPMKLRRPHLDRYRRMLRESLHNPGLASEQRDYIKQQLSLVGQPKVYGSRSSSASPGSEGIVASSPVSTPVPAEPSSEPTSPTETLPNEAALNSMLKADIAAQAELEGIEGVSTSQTKSVMIETLLAGR